MISKVPWREVKVVRYMSLASEQPEIFFKTAFSDDDFVYIPPVSATRKTRRGHPDKPATLSFERKYDRLLPITNQKKKDVAVHQWHHSHGISHILCKFAFRQKWWQVGSAKPIREQRTWTNVVPHGIRLFYNTNLWMKAEAPSKDVLDNLAVSLCYNVGTFHVLEHIFLFHSLNDDACALALHKSASICVCSILKPFNWRDTFILLMWCHDNETCTFNQCIEIKCL